MPGCDLIITGARVIDGNGGASRFVDVAIERERIVDIGECAGWQADTLIDASGLALAPGFIDCHTHDDLAVFKTPDVAFKISQGVTTVIAGNCGISLAPLQPVGEMPPPFPLLGEPREFRFPSVKSYREALTATPGAVNLALLAGHSSLRLASMPDRLDRTADSDALAQMQQNLRLALQQGCIGMSTGLGYPPADDRAVAHSQTRSVTAACGIKVRTASLRVPRVASKRSMTAAWLTAGMSPSTPTS